MNYYVKYFSSGNYPLHIVSPNNKVFQSPLVLIIRFKDLFPRLLPFFSISQNWSDNDRQFASLNSKRLLVVRKIILVVVSTSLRRLTQLVNSDLIARGLKEGNCLLFVLISILNNLMRFFSFAQLVCAEDKLSFITEHKLHRVVQKSLQQWIHILLINWLSFHCWFVTILSRRRLSNGERWNDDAFHCRLCVFIIYSSLNGFLFSFVCLFFRWHILWLP